MRPLPKSDFTEGCLMITLSTPILNLHAHVPRVGPKTAQKLAFELGQYFDAPEGVVTVEDLLAYLPFRYEDRARLLTIRDLNDGRRAALELEVRVAGCYPIRTKTGRPLTIFEITGRDAHDQVRAFWWNQPFLANTFANGQRVVLYGEWRYSNRHGCFQIENPEFEILTEAGDEDDEPETAAIHTGRRVPIYRKLGTFRTRALRALIHRTLALLTGLDDETLPPSVIARFRPPTRLEALTRVHFPAEDVPLDQYQAGRSPAHARLALEEFFLLSLSLYRRREIHQRARKATAIEVTDHIREVVRRILPFKPTAAQKRVVKEIVTDLTSDRTMHRLVQGDVGAGKTIVAIQAMVVAIENGYQVAMMAPTEILAEQHALTIRRVLNETTYRIARLSGSLKPTEKAAVRKAIAAGELDIVVGTQALIQESTEFARLGLIVIDEQHRFGVIQRAQLAARGLNPEVLVMTATPIPRSLAMTVYGDLDVSVIDELPPGRRAIRTVTRTDAERAKVYEFIRSEAQAGRQTYIVFPLVEESEKMDLKAATQAVEHLQKHVFPDLSVGLLHGKMKPAEKEAVMGAFAAGACQVLVSTTVIEVGVDVPNATVMVVEHPERFGLAQLHQLRGRIGRGAAQSYCILMTSKKTSSEANERLRVLTESQDGFVIAEKDLEIRGPGEVLGTRQSGAPVFRIGNIVRDRDWLEAARDAAREVLAEGRLSRDLARWLDLAQRRFPQSDVSVH